MKKYIQMISELLELGAALFVLIGILIAAAGMLINGGRFELLFQDVVHFREFLEQVFTLVVGIEFLQMLCKPNSDNVLEALIFLVARHMIVGETTAFDDFLSVISIILLCVLRRYLHNAREDRARHEHEQEQLHSREEEADPAEKKQGFLQKIQKWM